MVSSEPVAVLSSQLDWEPQSDLLHYNSMLSDHSDWYSVVPAYLGAALSEEEYLLILNKIHELTKISSKWIILQEININESGFYAYFLGIEKETSAGIRAYACLGRTFHQSKHSLFDDKKLEQKIFNKNLSDTVDISEYSADGTMFYITIAYENRLRRLAIFNLREGHKRSDIVEIVSLIKSAAISKSEKLKRFLFKLVDF